MKCIENGLLRSTLFKICHCPNSLDNFFVVIYFEHCIHCCDTFNNRARENCKSHSTNNENVFWAKWKRRKKEKKKKLTKVDRRWKKLVRQNVVENETEKKIINDIGYMDLDTQRIAVEYFAKNKKKNRTYGIQ